MPGVHIYTTSSTLSLVGSDRPAPPPNIKRGREKSERKENVRRGTVRGFSVSAGCSDEPILHRPSV